MPTGRSYRNAILNSGGLVAYWPMSETSGALFRDALGLNDATTTGSPTLGVNGPLSGSPNAAAAFVRTSSQAATTAAPVTSVVDDWTIMVWVVASASATTRCIFYNGATGSINGYGLYLNPSNSLWGFAEGGGGGGNLTTGSGNTALNSTLWSFAVLVRRSGTSSTYLNGVLDETGTTNAPVTPTGLTSIGAEAGNVLFMDGSVAHPAIFKRPLSPIEIADFYRLGRGF